MDHVIARIRSYKLANGKWAPGFNVHEHSGASIKEINHYFGKDHMYESKKEADELAKNSAIKLLRDKYRGMKFRIEVK